MKVAATEALHKILPQQWWLVQVSSTDIPLNRLVIPPAIEAVKWRAKSFGLDARMVRQRAVYFSFCFTQLGHAHQLSLNHLIEFAFSGTAASRTNLIQWCRLGVAQAKEFKFCFSQIS